MSDAGTKTDPLSAATRLAKRNLLAASLVAIVVTAFNVSIEKIPVAALQISFDKGAFDFLLLVVLIYFLVQFCVYYYVDVRNFKRLQHQTATESWHREKVAASVVRFIERHSKWLKKQIKTAFVTIDPTPKLEDYLGRITEGHPSPIRLWREMKRDRHGFIGLMWQLHSLNSDAKELDIDPGRIKAEERRLIGRAQSNLYRYPLYYALSQASAVPRVLFVHAMYFLRVYGLDGVLPVLTAALALLAMWHVIDARWLASIAPARS
jgi:hypothetical protein